MSAPNLDLAALIAALASASAKIPDALDQVHSWMNGGGPKPNDVLAELPDLSRNDLELAAMRKRSGLDP